MKKNQWPGQPHQPENPAGRKFPGFSLAYGLTLVMAYAFYFFVGNASGAMFTWDAGSNGTNNTGTVISGSGNWDITSLNWNNGTADVVWTQTSTTAALNGAIFGGGDGTYAINNAVQVAATNITINNSGYTFSGGGIYLAPNGLLTLAGGKAATFDCNFVSGNNVEDYLCGAGATMTFNGNFGGQQPHFLGPTNSAYYLGGNNTPSVLSINAPLYLTGGGLTVSASFFVAYNSGSTINGTNYTVGSLTISGGGTANQNGGNMTVGRGGGQGTLTLLNGTVNVGVSGSAARLLQATADTSVIGGVPESGTINVYGGTVNVGAVGSSTLNGAIQLSSGGSVAGETAILNQTNGIINAWGGIQIGAATGTFTGGSAMLTNSGGSLYLGPSGIFLGAKYPPTNNITLSGGTVGALGAWSSSLPMTLTTNNGSITFQCADINNTPHNITLSGPLTGPGGLNVTGGGSLTLVGTNTYAGTTTVSNGTLQILTSPTVSSGGPVVIDGSVGTPTVNIGSKPGQTWSIGGLTFQNGSSAFVYNFNYFGSLTPSTLVAPVSVNGNLNFASTPNVQIIGSAIPVGAFPLIAYTGSLAGTLPASVTLPGGVLGYLTNDSTSQTISLVVTNSSFKPFLVWSAGNGVWDETTLNWEQNGTPAPYADGDQVLFDDSASGSTPITITNNITVSPLSVAANNLAKSYDLEGTGSIAGPATLTISGGGTLTLGEANSYSGGTILSAGQLNINNGGDSSGADSAIGVGPLTNNSGVYLDNTSGSNVLLIPSIPETWNGNFTYLGSSNSLDMGSGPVVMNGNVALTVLSNTFEIDGSINDNGNDLKLSEQGNGALTLMGNNTFGGGFELFSGQLNLGNSFALDSASVCTIDSGSIDNVSGGNLVMYAYSYIWAGSFSYLGTLNNFDFGSGTIIAATTGNMTVNVVANTLITEGDIIPGNHIITKIGMGTWDIAGYGTAAQNLSLTVNQGTVLLDKESGYAINGAVSGLLVQSNSLAYENGLGVPEINYGHNTDPVVVTTGGAYDMNGNSETVDSFSSTNGIIRNSAVGGTSTLKIGYAGSVATLAGTNCGFDVPDQNGVLNLNGIVTGTGSLVKTGLGLLNLEDTNSYTGNTTINSGTLELNAPGLATTSIVTLSNGAAINLNFANADTNQIAALVLDGVVQTNGLYNATTTPGFITGSGTLLVALPPPVVNPLPGPIQFGISGNTLQLSWPTNLGWVLQSQTNALNTGLSTNGNAWIDVVGSGGVTATNLTIDPNNPSVFFRLRTP